MRRLHGFTLKETLDGHRMAERARPPAPTMMEASSECGRGLHDGNAAHGKAAHSTAEHLLVTHLWYPTVLVRHHCPERNFLPRQRVSSGPTLLPILPKSILRNLRLGSPELFSCSRQEDESLKLVPPPVLSTQKSLLLCRAFVSLAKMAAMLCQM
ncbi:hypothetical protein RvY_09102 [Ramazzottius varieornatus]|uniref:Uncharacterized protein n=1 Tax=Ramazzottius varieornatus TaxID=947166 RepID=A0A1D1V881_RAMVA|nr:hypothetical protein RvY_09102 [Ramazzottius varieornatus]